MMNKKKILAMLLVSSTVASNLTGCSSLVGTDVSKSINAGDYISEIKNDLTKYPLSNY